jgi:hypothetical protein
MYVLTITIFGLMVWYQIKWDEFLLMAYIYIYIYREREREREE